MEIPTFRKDKVLYILHYEFQYVYATFDLSFHNLMLLVPLSLAILFCRVVIGLLFAASFWGKATELHAFELTIAKFNLFPARFSRPAAWLMVLGELAVVVLMFFEGVWLVLGLALAACLLLGFSAALASVLVRKIETSCNCFGASARPVTRYDLWRNACFIACALAGCGASLASAGPASRPELWQMGVVALMAAVFVGIVTQLDEIAGLFQ